MKVTAIITDQFKNTKRVDFQSKKKAIEVITKDWGWNFFDWEFPTFYGTDETRIYEAVLYPTKQVESWK